MAIDKKLIDQLLADYKKPEDIIGYPIVYLDAPIVKVRTSNVTDAVIEEVKLWQGRPLKDWSRAGLVLSYPGDRRYPSAFPFTSA